MTLEEQINQILKDFENTSSEKFLDILNQVNPHFKSNLTSEYLEGKIQKISEISEESEKKKQCKTLFPYFDWYLQGL